MSERDFFCAPSCVNHIYKDKGGKGDRTLGMANVWIRLNSSAFDDVSVPNCALRSAAVTIVDKNLSHIIAAGYSFRVAARSTIIIAARSRRPCLSGYLNFPPSKHILENYIFITYTFFKRFTISRPRMKLKIIWLE